jgi:hypothetical protein
LFGRRTELFPEAEHAYSNVRFTLVFGGFCGTHLFQKNITQKKLRGRLTRPPLRPSDCKQPYFFLAGFFAAFFAGFFAAIDLFSLHSIFIEIATIVCCMLSQRIE